ncbi:MAG TPA: hypothetical protein VJJ52_06785 [Candidatus Nanoarchaeia archaeon]|nr:hypothetical protein [Candidatus Nanoarchaeia archaeon]
MNLTPKQWIPFLIVALVFIIIEAKGLTQVGPGDENVYFYMAKAMSEGQMPYRDFFYAHPPLHIFLLSVLINIFGINFFILKFAALAFLLTASFFLYKLSLELFQNKFNDKSANLISMISVIIFLYSFTTLFTATFSVGIELSVMLMMVSFYLTFSKEYFVGGIFAGLAGLTRFYALVPLLVLFAFIFVKKLQEKRVKDFLILSSGFLMIFGIVMILLTALYGHNFTDSVIKYHFLKPKLPGQKLAVFENVIKENWIIFTVFLLILFAQNKKRLQLPLFVVFFYFLFLLTLNFAADFYFIIVFPFMALVGAYSLTNVLTRLNIKYLRYALVTMLILVFLWNTAADVMFLEKIGFLEFSPLQKMVAKVSATSSNMQIFGDASIAPLLSLMSNRSLALNYIDTNEMTFTSGLTNFYLFTDTLDEINLSYIIFRKNSGLHQISQFKQYAQSRCKLEESYTDRLEGEFLMYTCEK